MYDAFRCRSALPFLAGLALLVGCDDVTSAPVSQQAPAATAGEPRAEDFVESRGPQVEFADLAIFLEYNSTDEDLGVQVFLDAEAWDRIRAATPTVSRSSISPPAELRRPRPD